LLEKLISIKNSIVDITTNKLIPLFKRVFKVSVFVFSSVLIGWVIAFFIGLNLPKTYVVETMKTYNYPAEDVWKEISSIQYYKEWKRDVRSAEYISEPGQTPVEYMEFYGMKPSVRFQLIQNVDGPTEKVWETRISGSSSSVISKWIYKLKPYKNQTVVTMRQTTEIKGAFDRFVAHYIDRFIAESDGFLFELDRRLKMVSNVDVASMEDDPNSDETEN
tara:strand:- start:2288 stop:2944 length:657 start_codon:yes stop_codon:yes gene_type:complete